MAASDEEALSPENRLKLLCSFGGRILPRPSDGVLKYIGGETRALTVPRSITFDELIQKIAGMFNAEVVIKYQLLPEDLDALVSVRNDEDLRFMIEEYDKHDHLPRSPNSAASPRFRLFLFSTATPAATAPTSPVAVAPGCDAINGNIRPIFMLSADTSPTNTIDASNFSHAAHLLSGRGGAAGRGGGMHRVRSTPNLGGTQLASNGVGGSPRMYNRHMHPHPQQCGYGMPGPTWRGNGKVCTGVVPMVMSGQQLNPQVMMPRYWHPQAHGHGGGNEGVYWHGGHDGGGHGHISGWGHGGYNGNDGGPSASNGGWGHGGYNGNDGGPSAIYGGWGHGGFNGNDGGAPANNGWGHGGFGGNEGIVSMNNSQQSSGGPSPRS